MYNQLTAEDFRRALHLPPDYTVDGVLCWGTMRKKKHRAELESVLSRLGLTAAFHYVEESGFFENIADLYIDGKRIWFDSSYGGAYLSELLHVACLLGSRKNILVGSCAGLHPNGNVGDIVIPVSSYGNESSTRMYEPGNGEFVYFSDEGLRTSLKDRIGDRFRVFEGGLMTCQANLMESWEDVVRWSSEGYVGIDMESATLFAVSNHFKVPSAALLPIVDNMIKQHTVFSEGHPGWRERLQEARFEIFRVAFEELLT